MTSALAASFMKIAWPSGLLRLSVIDFLLRCRFWKSKPWRVLPVASVPSLEGCSILITCAPQSASWRTAVGPARCAVRSRTEICESGRLVIRVSSWERGPPGPLMNHEAGLEARGPFELSPLEGGLPLFHEGAAAFLEVLAVEARRRHGFELLVVLLGL